MSQTAKVLHHAITQYNGFLTRSDKWQSWAPNNGDILVCTPAKCGTTWTQTIIAMLLYGTTELPDRVSALSPWVDSTLGDTDHVERIAPSPSGRRVFKTHTPADGFPVWEGVDVVAVYRHPLDVFLSIRKHVENMKDVENPLLCGPMDEAVTYYLGIEFDQQDIDRDSLAALATHYARTVSRPDLGRLTLLHYADMLKDHRAAVAKLAETLRLDHDDALIDAVTSATRIDAMRAQPDQFVPEGGKGFWHSDANFFRGGGTEKWRDHLTAAQIARFEAALADNLPDPAAQAWVQRGNSG